MLLVGQANSRDVPRAADVAAMHRIASASRTLHTTQIKAEYSNGLAAAFVLRLAAGVAAVNNVESREKEIVR
jgi:hypothetical protein